MGWFRKRDYSTAVVIERLIHDSCDVLVGTRYYIEYTTTLFGFYIYKEKFFEWSCGMGDCYASTDYRLTKAALLSDFDEFLIRNRKTLVTDRKIDKVNEVNC